MSIADIARSAREILSQAAQGVGTLFETFTTPIGETFPQIDWQALPIDISGYTLFSVFLGAGLTVFLVYSLAKWILDIVL